MTDVGYALENNTVDREDDSAYTKTDRSAVTERLPAPRR